MSVNAEQQQPPPDIWHAHFPQGEAARIGGGPLDDTSGTW